VLPKEIISSRQPGSALITSQDQQKEKPHQGIDHLLSIRLFCLVFLIDLQKSKDDLICINSDNGMLPL
jgi:hypothetical protein